MGVTDEIGLLGTGGVGDPEHRGGKAFRRSKEVAKLALGEKDVNMCDRPAVPSSSVLQLLLLESHEWGNRVSRNPVRSTDCACFSWVQATIFPKLFVAPEREHPPLC